MRVILFDGKHNVSKDEVLEKMNYFLNAAEKGMEVHKDSPQESLNIARRLRDELEKEYKNNSLKRIREFYNTNSFFNYYRPAVHDAVASITGRLTYKNLHRFLYDVSDYMRHYMPNSD